MPGGAKIKFRYPQVYPKRPAMLDDARLAEMVQVVHGELPGADEITLMTVVRDSSFFLDAFLHHHRSIGVQRFVVLDDWSGEDFFQRLRSEQDVTVLRVPFRYPERLTWSDDSGSPRKESVGTIYKDIVTRHFVKYPWTLVLDIDEFLITPPNLDLRRLLSSSKSLGWGVLATQMVDMLPESWPPIETLSNPRTFRDLSRAYPFFKPEPAWRKEQDVIYWEADCNAISDVFRQMRVYSGPPFLRPLKRIARPFMPHLRTFPRSDVAKVPLVGPSHRHLRRSPHGLQTAVGSPIMLAIAHFTFTTDFERKIETYLTMRSRKSRFASRSRYQAYYRLLKKIESKGGLDFSGFGFEIFDGYESFQKAGVVEPLPSS